MSNEPGVEIQTPFARLRAHGEHNANLILLAATVAFMAFIGWQMQAEHRDIVNTISKVNGNLNDLFLATVLTPEQKDNLPMVVQEKVKEKVQEKTQRKLAE